jgi:hypothetical protein
MFKLIITFLLSFSITSCAGIIRTEHIHKGIDPEFQVGYDVFVKHIAKPKYKVTIGFVDNLHKDYTKETIGMAHKVLIGYSEIDISRTFWEYASQEERYILLFHELAHAVCNLRHSEQKDFKYIENVGQFLRDLGVPFYGYNPDNCPMSIMSPIIPNNYCSKRYFKNYMISLHDLRGKCK